MQTSQHSRPFSLPCLPQDAPRPAPPLLVQASQSTYCHRFRRFSPNQSGSAFSPTAACPTTGMISRRPRTIRAVIMKSESRRYYQCTTLVILLNGSIRLGHLGDQVFGFAITNLIQDLYPRLRVGPASVCQYGIIHFVIGLTLWSYRK
jgi:hypothetical protein